jgi:WD40 repeat protein
MDSIKSRLLVAVLIASWTCCSVTGFSHVSDLPDRRPREISIYSPNLKYEKRQSGGISALAFSPDGTVLASATSNHALSLIDVESGWEVRTLAKAAKNPYFHGNAIASLLFSPDGNILIATGDAFDDLLTGSEACFWETHSGRKERTIVVYKVPWIPSLYAKSGASGKAIITTAAILMGAFWPVSFGNSAVEILEPDQYALNTRTTGSGFLADGRTLLVAFRMGPNGGRAPAKGVVKARDVKDGSLTGGWTLDESILSASESPDDRVLALGCNAKIQLWDVRRHSVQRSIDTAGTCGYVGTISFSSDGRMIAFGSGSYLIPDFGRPDLIERYSRARKMVYIWDSETSRLGAINTIEPADVSAIAFSPDGNHLAVGNRAGTFRLYQIK